MEQEYQRQPKSELQDQIYKASKESFNNLVKLCTKPICRRRIILEFFDETPSFSKKDGCKNCDFCTNPQKVEQLIKRATSSTKNSFNV